MDKIKIVYMGTPDFSVLPLKKLDENYDVIAVVTQPDKEVGRKREIKFSPVKEYAVANNIKVIQPIKIKEEYKEILELNPDVIITCAYGQIIPKELLDFPKYGCINIHASLLPKLRGGAPIHKAIIDGYDETGVSIMYMDEKMDSGDIIYQEKIKIEESDNVGTLFDKLSILGSNMIIKVLPDIINGNINRIVQDESEVTYAYNIKPEEEKIDFNKSSKEVFNQIRGLNPWPVGYALLDDKKIKIYSSEICSEIFSGRNGEIVKLSNDGICVKTNDTSVILKEIKPEGKKQMAVRDYLNGIKDKNEFIGKIFK